jgi:hypothetical protein
MSLALRVFSTRLPWPIAAVLRSPLPFKLQLLAAFGT